MTSKVLVFECTMMLPIPEELYWIGLSTPELFKIYKKILMMQVLNETDCLKSQWVLTVIRGSFTSITSSTCTIHWKIDDKHYTKN